MRNAPTLDEYLGTVTHRLRALTLHAVALGLVISIRAVSCAWKALCAGSTSAQRRDEFLLLQLVLDGQRRLREPLKAGARMELQLFEFREDDQRAVQRRRRLHRCALVR